MRRLNSSPDHSQRYRRLGRPASGKWRIPRAAPLLRLTSGAHIVVRRSRIGHTRAITCLSPIDGRVMFILPWGDLSYIGTTDTDYSGDPAQDPRDRGGRHLPAPLGEFGLPARPPRGGRRGLLLGRGARAAGRTQP